MYVHPTDPTVKARVPNWMMEATKKLADMQDVPVSEIVRQALHKHLDQHELHAPGYKVDK